jgi:hypothetical protein
MIADLGRIVKGWFVLWGWARCLKQGQRWLAALAGGLRWSRVWEKGGSRYVVVDESSQTG